MNTELKLEKLIGNKRILFLEDDMGLHNAVGNFYEWVLQKKYNHNSIFDIGSLPINYIMNQIEWFDIICFETQFVNDIAKDLYKAISAMKTSKIIIECYVYDPLIKRKPKGIKHQIITLDCYEEIKDPKEWKFTKL